MKSREIKIQIGNLVHYKSSRDFARQILQNFEVLATFYAHFTKLNWFKLTGHTIE